MNERKDFMAIKSKKPLYKVSSQLEKGFQGHITYTTILPDDLSRLKVTFSFDKLHAEQDIEELQAGCREALMKNLEEETELLECMASAVYHLPKSEINVSLFLNDVCVGSAHRNQLTKEIWISEEESSLGFNNCRPAGVFSIVLHVLNILNDDTACILTVEGVERVCL
ncbi:DUF6669 family protein [Scatolibacter rhodanostii]|uniref:DUF6669 family protein n=1 Tax=Scatolibacter rhodanostii TaxID=2014781 RepID=UPI001180547E|nr:DUF6669 family protein [Scatolibacter rhodanostii]